MRQFAVCSSVLSLAILGLTNSQIAAVPLLSDKPTKWEYSELIYRPIRNFDDPNQGKQPAPVQTPAIRWVTAESEVTAANWEELAEKLKAKPAIKGATTTTHKLRVFDRLGLEGWEMVAPPNPTTTPSSTWTFKRRVP